MNDGNNGGRYACKGVGIYKKLLYLPLTLVVNFKMFQNISLQKVAYFSGFQLL